MKRLGTTDARVVDQEINVTPPGNRQVHDTLRCIVVGQIDSQRDNSSGIVNDPLELGELALVSAGTQHRHARLRKFDGATKTNAAACARDDCYLHALNPPLKFAMRLQ